MSNKPIILETDGILGQLPNGGIINAGGTSNESWTVNGRGLLFDDGQSSAPGGGQMLSLQHVYDSSQTVNGSANIKLSTGKDLTISDDTDDGIYFKIDSETGKVTITGDLEVLGSSSTINTIVQDSDHWLISPKSRSTTPLKIEPDSGVVPIVDLVSVRNIFGGSPVFRIDADGNLISTKSLTISGLINNVDIVQLRSDLNHHLSGDVGWRHQATSIDILPISTLPNASNVQEALERLNNKVDSIPGGGGTGGTGNVSGYEHVQSVDSVQWLVTHNMNSFRCQVTVYDDDWEVIIPDKIKIIENNTLLVMFSSPISGRAMIFAF